MHVMSTTWRERVPNWLPASNLHWTPRTTTCLNILRCPKFKLLLLPDGPVVVLPLNGRRTDIPALLDGPFTVHTSARWQRFRSVQRGNEILLQRSYGSWICGCEGWISWTRGIQCGESIYDSADSSVALRVRLKVYELLIDDSGPPCVARICYNFKVINNCASVFSDFLTATSRTLELVINTLAIQQTKKSPSSTS